MRERGRVADVEYAPSSSRRITSGRFADDECQSPARISTVSRGPPSGASAAEAESGQDDREEQGGRRLGNHAMYVCPFLAARSTLGPSIRIRRSTTAACRGGTSSPRGISGG